MPESTVPRETSTVVPPAPDTHVLGGWRNPKVLAALLTAIAAIVVAYLQLGPKAPIKEKLTLAGRVYSQHSSGIYGATLTLVVQARGFLPGHHESRVPLFFRT
jgi:hypothetical protein